MDLIKVDIHNYDQGLRIKPNHQIFNQTQLLETNNLSKNDTFTLESLEPIEEVPHFEVLHDQPTT